MYKDTSKEIAYLKPVHVSTGKNERKYITDGRNDTFWMGDYYPACIDINLENNYCLDRMEIRIPEAQTLCYTIYTSMNGRDYDRILDSKECEVSFHNVEAKSSRIHIEYAYPSEKPVVNQILVFGTESKTPVAKTPEICVSDFADTKYACEITKQDTYNEIMGIIERRLGKQYQNWFELELADYPMKDNQYDYFELTDRNGRIHIKGNNGVSIASGLHHYLKEICKVHISQVGDQVRMPGKVVPVSRTIYKETKAKIRYAYNYCTFSYSMPFYGKKEWRNELDWLALNGVNLVLDITGQEEVWRRFLGKLGYSHEDIKDFIAGPAYYAWAYMANLSGFGGPVHDSWFEERVELARENYLIMRKLGMQPVLQGYSGMVPNDIWQYDSNVEIIEQGTWCGFQRPAMLKTTSESFNKYAQMFYCAQKDVYGNVSHYYATDSFHEGGNTADMNTRDVSRHVLSAMMEADADATWVIQSWQGNPTSELLAGLEELSNGKKHALILDLYAEKLPHYGEGNAESKAYGYSAEFNDTPWVFCMLNNFGGRLGMHGHLDNLASNIPNAFNQCSSIAGIGIAPEASANNPVLYDFLFEIIWQQNAKLPMEAISLKEWLKRYAERRYGASSVAVDKAWEILMNTVYKAEWNLLGQGAPECIAIARPARKIRAASAWGNTIISYDTRQLEEARDLLLKDYELLKGSEGYLYDMATIEQQVLSNKSLACFQEMINALGNRQKEEFECNAKEFLQLIDEMELVTSSNEHYRLDRWIRQAEQLAEHADDFSKKMYVWNAKMLITTWGSYEQSEKGKLHDYSNRQWSGMIKEFYKPRWERWIEERRKELKGECFDDSINWFEWEWNWTRS